MVAQFTAKTTNSEKAIYFLSIPASPLPFLYGSVSFVIDSKVFQNVLICMTVFAKKIQSLWKSLYCLE